MRVWNTHPRMNVTLHRGAGASVFDDTGRRCLDLLAGTWCCVLGHGHPRLVRAVTDQLVTLAHVAPSVLVPEVDDALERLAKVLLSPLSRGVLLNTGSEAVELGLKMARAATGERAVAVIERSYYGATISALSLSELGRTASYLPPVPDLLRLPAPHCARCPAGREAPCTEGFPCLDDLAARSEEIERGARPLAAVLYEPVLANAGVVVPPLGYGRRLAELTHRAGALLLANEVTTGLGRTGRWVAFEQEGIVPDILVLGKALGAGLPVSAVVTSAEVEERCRGRLLHVQSHQNDPLSGRIVATVLSILEDEDLVARAAQRGALLLELLERLAEEGPWFQEVRGRGLLVGVEFAAQWAERGSDVVSRLFERGFLVNYQPHTAALRLFPPYVIDSAEIESFVAALRSVLLDVATRDQRKE